MPGRAVIAAYKSRMSAIRRIVQGHMFKASMGMLWNQALNILLNIGLMAILARTLSLHDMGRYQLLLAFIAFGQVAGLPGMDVIINKGVLKGMDGIVRPALKASFLTACGAGILLLAAGLVLLEMPEYSVYGRTMLLVSLFIPLKGLEKYDSIFLGKRNFRLTRRLNTFSSLFSIATMGSVSILTGRMEYVVAAFFGVRCVTVALGLHLAMRMLDGGEIPAEDRRALLDQGWTQTVFNIVGIVIGQVDKVVLGMMDPKLLAIYYMGSVIPTRIKDNVKSLFGVVTMYWSSKSKADNMEKIESNMKWIFLLGIGLSGLVWAASPFVIPIFYGQGYRGSIIVSQLLSVSLCLNFYTYFFATLDVYQNRGHSWNVQNTIRQVFYLALLALLVPRYQILGVVVSTLMADALNAAFAFYHFNRKASGPDGSGSKREPIGN
jgi:O-antigen/teichoic acid export membrane protein